MLKFVDCIFSATGADRNAKVYGLTLNGEEEALLERCTFNGTGYAAVLNKTAGDVTIKDCDFECGNYKNPIEGDAGTAIQGNLTVEDCSFTGVPGNNFINIYQAKEGATHLIKGCDFHGGYDNNIVRLSNKNNASAVITLEDCSCEFVEGELSEYTGIVLCQDYTNKNGIFQDFSLYEVNINNLEWPEEGSLVYCYTDGIGIDNENHPVLYVNGETSVWMSGEDMIEEEGQL